MGGTAVRISLTSFKPIRADALAGHPRPALTALLLVPTRFGWFSHTQPRPKQMGHSGSIMRRAGRAVGDKLLSPGSTT